MKKFLVSVESFAEAALSKAPKSDEGTVESAVSFIRWKTTHRKYNKKNPMDHTLHRHHPKKRSLGLLFPSQSEPAEEELFPEAEAELKY